MLTLGIDTATDVCAVALVESDRVLFEASIAVPRAHGKRLAPLITEALAHVGREASDLDLVAVSSGPGSYTGLRIGMSTAKGLVLATGAAFVAVPTLAALARGAGGTVAVILPSRRGEVYAAVYRSDDEVSPPAALAIDAVPDWLPADLDAIGGPGANRIAEHRPETARLDLSASGSAVARLGLHRFDAFGPEDPATAEPAYLKAVAVSMPKSPFA